ncbi:ATP-binding protein [Caulobacter endophyticus]|uniref:histidine kinase n=1 Tax=Caulobacter endophyticus TaxID=2172652 RepID=A0A2T9KD69_9CAUL|nr:ATP-binding protein [Caulobacter endophyticus]PVM93791.1 two-component sensor histidine kinase [Caulobacter endophyticus]
MKFAVPGRGGAPLFAQALGLALVTLVATILICVAVVFNVPPPPPELYKLSEISRALKSGETVHPRDGRPLLVRHRATVKPDGEDSQRRAEFKAAIGRELNVPVDRISIRTENGPRFFVRTARQKGPPPPPGPGGPRPGGPGGPGGPGALNGPGAPGGPPPPPPVAITAADRIAAVMRDEPFLFGDFQLGIRQSDGRWLVVEPKFTLLRDTWQVRILLILALSVVAVSPLAWLFARRLAGPITAFAAAAERLGRDPRAPPLSLSGSAEVAAAANAFNEMQERLRRYVEDRTAMIGAVAHDLRTPLTRLRFRIETTPDDVRAKLESDIDQMEAMISATLAFVRDTSRPAERTKLELASLLESVMDEAAETGGDATAEESDKIVIEGDPIALKRLVTNLVENALKYGGAARGRVYRQTGGAVLEIDDNGPGVPSSELDRVFEPFFRGEPSRNRETGGIGLGLAVVRSLARAHGGDVTLLNRPEGGLRARVTLPA